MSTVRDISFSRDPVGSRHATCVLDLEHLRVVWMSDPQFFASRRGDSPIGQKFQSLVSLGDRPSAARALTIAVQTGQASFEGIGLTGQRFQADLCLRHGADRKPQELIIELHEQGAPDDYSFHMLLESIPLPVWIATDRRADSILGNKTAEEATGFKRGQNQSLSQPEDTLTDQYRIYRDGRECDPSDLPMQRAARKGEHVRDEEYEIRYKFGRVDNVILNASPMYDKTGEIIGCSCIQVDITERKNYEAAQKRLLECSRATGQEFFEALVSAISQTLKAKKVIVAECVPGTEGRFRTLAAMIDGKPGSLGEFCPIGTPCNDVARGESVFIPSGVPQLYPSEMVTINQVESYVGAPLKSSDGQVIGLIAVMHDEPVTGMPDPLEIVEIFASRAGSEIQRIRDETTLRLSEQKYRIITNVNTSLIAFVDAEQRYQFVNHAYEQWFGFSPDKLLGRKLCDVMPADTYNGAMPYIRRALSGEHVKAELYLPDICGRPRHIQLEYVPQIVNGKVEGFYGFITDISDRKKHEEELRKSEERFRTLFAHLPVGAALIDRHGHVVLENDVFSRLLPHGSNDDSELTFGCLLSRACTLHGQDKRLVVDANRPVDLALRGIVTRDAEFLCRYQGGREIWVRLSSIPVKNENQEVTAALVMIADVDMEKRAEDRRTLLMNELNHRVKNTLTSVQSIASQTFSQGVVCAKGLDTFEERLMALSNTHNLLSEESWEGADLRSIIDLVLQPNNLDASRLTVGGPSVRLKPGAALAFAMALHELATNATKYGALSNPDGRVSIDWDLTGQNGNARLKFAWSESGGPETKQPQRKGFGTRLIERALAFELGGSNSSMRFEPDGLVCEIDAELSEITN